MTHSVRKMFDNGRKIAPRIGLGILQRTAPYFRSPCALWKGQASFPSALPPVSKSEEPGILPANSGEHSGRQEKRIDEFRLMDILGCGEKDDSKGQTPLRG